MAITVTLDILHLYIAPNTDMDALIGILKEEVARLVTDTFFQRLYVYLYLGMTLQHYIIDYVLAVFIDLQGAYDNYLLQISDWILAYSDHMQLAHCCSLHCV